MFTLSISLILGVVSSIALLGYAKKVKSFSVEDELLQQKEKYGGEIQGLDKAIASGAQVLSDMGRLSEYTQYLDNVSTSSTNYEKVVQESRALDNHLKNQQAEVEEREKQQIKIKEGRQDCQRRADQIRESTDQLNSEFERLKTALLESREQVASLADQIELSAQQKEALDEVVAMLGQLEERHSALAKDHGTSTERFLSLENQYSELELEYSRLVQRSLSPEGQE